ncbi:MAG: hypothetical protein KDA61_00985 [Planctomycetales bacterium]|nr:hypothetical protein [Planctomycetales bacterium]
MKTMRTILSLAPALLLATGCGVAPEAESVRTDVVAAASTAKSPVIAPAGAATPQDAFQAFSAAMRERRYADAARRMTKPSQQMIAGGFILGASFAAMDDESQNRELETLLARHKIKLDDESEPMDEAPRSAEQLMEELTAPAPDLPALIGELGSWIDQHSDGPGNGFPDVRELQEVRVEGDSANAIATTDRGPQPVEFRKTSQGWLVHLPSEPGPPGDDADSGAAFDKDGEIGDELMDEASAGATTIGSLYYGDEEVALRHAIAYEAKLFGEPTTVVLLTAQPLSRRERQTLDQMLVDEGTDDAFFIRGPHVKLRLDEGDQLTSYFAWIDNQSISRNSGVDVDVVRIERRLMGNASVAEEFEVAGKSFRFDALLDVEIADPARP